MGPGVKWSQPRQVSVLEDPHQRPVRGADRQEVHDHGLGGQQDRAQEHEQHDVGGGHDERHRPRRVRAHQGQEIEVEGGVAGDQQRAPRRAGASRGCAARGCAPRRCWRGTAVCTTSSAMCRPIVWASAPWIAGGPRRAHDRQHLVLAQRERRIEVDEALDALDSRLRGEPAAQVVELRRSSAPPAASPRRSRESRECAWSPARGTPVG